MRNKSEKNTTNKRTFTNINIMFANFMDDYRGTTLFKLYLTDTFKIKFKNNRTILTLKI